MAASSLYRMDHDDPEPGDEAFSAPTRVGSLDIKELIGDDEGIPQEHTVLMPSAPPKTPLHAGDYALAALQALPPAPNVTLGFAATIPAMYARSAPVRVIHSRPRRVAWRITGAFVGLVALAAALYLVAIVAL